MTGSPDHGTAVPARGTGPWRIAASRVLARIHVNAWVAAGLILLILFAFWPTFTNEFVQYDDQQLIVEHPRIKGGLTANSAIWAFTATENGNWFPLTRLSHLLDVSIFGMNPSGHHAVSLILHASASVILFLALWSMTGALWASAFAAALFALHPLRVESVAWASERKDVLSGLFWMFTMAAYASYTKRPGIARYAVVFAGVACGIMSKPTMVNILPVRLSNSFSSYLTYIRNTFWPAGLSVVYPHTMSRHPWNLALGTAVTLAAVTLLVCWLGRRRPYVLVGWFWYLGTMVPMIGFVQVGSQGMADRYTYLPTIGILMMVAWGGKEATGRLPVMKKPLVAGACAIIAVLALLTRVQTGHWRDSAALFSQALRQDPKNLMARVNLGMALSKKGRLEEASEQYRIALGIFPNLLEVNYMLANDLSNLGRLQEAADAYSREIRIRPTAHAHLGLGSTLAKLGQDDEAIVHFKEAIRYKPTLNQARMALGSIFLKQGRLAEAYAQYATAVQLEPNLSTARESAEKVRSMMRREGESTAP